MWKIVNCGRYLAFSVLIVAGLAYLSFLMYDARRIQAKWDLHLANSGNPVQPKPGQITIRTIEGDRPNHWKMYIRCSDAYGPYLFASVTRFNPVDPQFDPFQGKFSPFICTSLKRDSPGFTPIPAMNLPAGGLLTVDFNLHQSIDGVWYIKHRGLTQYVLEGQEQLYFKNGGKPVDPDSIHFAGQESTRVLDASTPVRLMHLSLTPSSSDTPAPLDGMYLYLIPPPLVAPKTGTEGWRIKPEYGP